MRRLFFAVGCMALVACASPSAALHGTALTPAKPAHPFTLIDQQGRPYTLGAQPGQAILLYFGFSHCKDICPQTLALLGKARAQAHLDAEQLRIVMVTVDPKRDTPAALAAFVRRVGVQATAVTGTPAQLQPVYRAYGVAIQPQKNDIGHTDFVYLIDGQGRLREILDPGMKAGAVADDLRAVVG